MDAYDFFFASFVCYGDSTYCLDLFRTGDIFSFIESVSLSNSFFLGYQLNPKLLLTISVVYFGFKRFVFCSFLALVNEFSFYPVF